MLSRRGFGSFTDTTIDTLVWTLLRYRNCKMHEWFSKEGRQTFKNLSQHVS